jgi:AraC-like DNA-binding protein
MANDQPQVVIPSHSSDLAHLLFCWTLHRMKEPNWTYLPKTPCMTVQAWGCAFGGFSEYAARPIHRLELPAAAVVIVLCCGEPMTLRPALRSGDSTRSNAFSAGLQVQAQRVSHAGSNDCVEIRLPPLAAYALFGGAMAEPNREPMSLLDAAPQSISMLLDQLQAKSSWERRLAAVDRFLALGLAESKRRIPPELTWAWEILDRSHGETSIRSLARTIGWSERHLINKFRAYCGVRPKTAARRLRFSHAFDLVSTHPTGNLSAIAAQAGFSDQSHMTREFQSFAGVTPGVLQSARFDDIPGIPAAVLDRVQFSSRPPP